MQTIINAITAGFVASVENILYLILLALVLKVMMWLHENIA